MKKIYAVALLLVVFPCSAGLIAQVSAHHSGGVESMALLTPETGWASTARSIFWTTDAGGHWRNVTPKISSEKNIDSVFFLDASTGWIVLISEDTGADEPRFDLARTTNAGVSWSIIQVKIPNLDPKSITLTGGGHIHFVDSSHGWLNLPVVSGAAFRLGILLATADGGTTWNWVPESPGVTGAIRFTSPEDGWLAGGPGNQELYVTHNGSKSWQKVLLEATPGLYPTYDQPPVFEGKQAFLPVTFSGPTDSAKKLVLFTSADHGQTWRPDRELPTPDEASEVVPSTVADSTWITASLHGQGRLTVSAVAPGGGATRTEAAIASPDSAVLRLSFVSKKQGWILTSAGLFSTNDGGGSLVNITPAAHGAATGVGPLPHDDLGEQSSIEQPPASSGTGPSIHLGFHACQAPSPSSLNTWWNSSPYFDLGIYIGGASRGCANSNLNLSWVTAVQNQGWGLMPLWSGPQAPCACWPKYPPPQCVPFPHVFSSVPTQAYANGVAEATSAITAASNLGLNLPAIYYDMEPYASATCGQAVRSFVSGWTSAMDGFGQDGIYGAPANAQADWWNASPQPHNVWIAKTFTNSPAAPVVTIWGLSPLPDSYWNTNPGSRIHQYLGNQAGVTWGGVALNIDEDIEDATVIAGTGTRTYSGFNVYDVLIGGVYTAYLAAINNEGNATGSFTDSSDLVHGFVDTAAGPVTIDYPGATWTEGTGLNDLGQVVGAAFPGPLQGGNEYGFFRQANGSMSAPINCPPAVCPGVFDTIPLGINDNQKIVGMWDSSVGISGFLLVSGQFQVINYPGALSTQANGINGDGQIVGIYEDSSGALHGFLDNAGVFTQIDYPGEQTLLCGINNNGQIIGQYQDLSLGGYWDDFLYSEADQSFMLLPSLATVTGLNDEAQISGAGFYATPTGATAGSGPSPSGPPPEAIMVDHAPKRARHHALRALAPPLGSGAGCYFTGD